MPITNYSKHSLTPEEKLLAALETATTFKGNHSLGRILLLPTKIESGVLLRYKEGIYDSKIAITCKLPPQERVIHLNDSDPANNLLTLQTPRLLFNFETLLHLDGGKGFLYKHGGGESTTEALKSLQHFFFPHIYHSGYVCTYITCKSPRSLNTRFWTSNFNTYWHRLYCAGNRWKKADLGDDANLIPGQKPSDYQAHMDSTSPKLDKENRETQNSFTNYLEIDEKPFGVFISQNKKVIKATKSNTISMGNTTLIMGFVFFKDQDYWVWLKDGSFLHLKPEQAGII